jgi:hypothetical protein
MRWLHRSERLSPFSYRDPAVARCWEEATKFGDEGRGAALAQPDLAADVGESIVSLRRTFIGEAPLDVVWQRRNFRLGVVPRRAPAISLLRTEDFTEGTPSLHCLIFRMNFGKLMFAGL